MTTLRRRQTGTMITALRRAKLAPPSIVSRVPTRADGHVARLRAALQEYGRHTWPRAPSADGSLRTHMLDAGVDIEPPC